jgi:hypothetical protein
MTAMEMLVLRYVSNHAGTHHKTVVEALGDRDWQQQKKVREALAVLTAAGTLQRQGTGPRSYRYTTKEMLIVRT